MIFDVQLIVVWQPCQLAHISCSGLRSPWPRPSFTLLLRRSDVWEMFWHAFGRQWGWQGGAGGSDGEWDRAATLCMVPYGEEESWDYLGCALRANPIECAQWAYPYGRVIKYLNASTFSISSCKINRKFCKMYVHPLYFFYFSISQSALMDGWLHWQYGSYIQK